MYVLSSILSIVNQSFIDFSLTVGIALFLPPQPILIQNGGMRFGHDGVARKLLTRATAGDTLLQNAVTGVAVPFGMFVHTAFTAAFYAGRTTAAVKAAFAQQIFLHSVTLFSHCEPINHRIHPALFVFHIFTLRLFPKEIKPMSLWDGLHSHPTR